MSFSPIYCFDEKKEDPLLILNIGYEKFVQQYKLCWNKKI